MSSPSTATREQRPRSTQREKSRGSNGDPARPNKQNLKIKSHHIRAQACTYNINLKLNGSTVSAFLTYHHLLETIPYQHIESFPALFVSQRLQCIPPRHPGVCPRRGRAGVFWALRSLPFPSEQSRHFTCVKGTRRQAPEEGGAGSEGQAS